MMAATLVLLLGAAQPMEAGEVGAAVGVGAQATCSLVHASGHAQGVNTTASATAGGTTTTNSGPVASNAVQVGLWPTSGSGTATTLGVTSSASASCDLSPLPIPDRCENEFGDRSLTTAAYFDDVGTTTFSGAFYANPNQPEDVYFVGTKNGASYVQAFDGSRTMTFDQTSDGIDPPGVTLAALQCPNLTVTLSGQSTARSASLLFR